MSGATAGTHPVSTIARILMMTDRQVQRLAAQGVLPNLGGGRYEVVPCVQAYIKYLRERTATDLKGEEFKASRSRLLTARARKAETEIEILSGNLLSRDTVEEAWGVILLNMRSLFLSFPTSYAPALHRAKSVSEVAALLKAAIDDALGELATAPAFAAPDPARLPGFTGDGESHAGTAESAADADAVGMV